MEKRMMEMETKYRVIRSYIIEILNLLTRGRATNPTGGATTVQVYPVEDAGK